MNGQDLTSNVRFSGLRADYRFHRPSLSLYRVEHGAETLVPELGRRALEVLNVLIEHAPETFSERVLLDSVWPPHADKRNLDVQIKNLRRVLEEGAPKEQLGCVIQNVPRRGYRFVREMTLILDEPLLPLPLPPVFDPSATAPQVQTVPDSALLLAVIKAATGKLRSFTEEQQTTINGLKTKLAITEELLEAICAVAMDNGVPHEQLRDEVIKIVRVCKEEIAKPLRGTFGGARPPSRHVPAPNVRVYDLASRERVNRLLQELLMIEVVDLEQQENGVYVLKGHPLRSQADIPEGNDGTGDRGG